MSPEQTDYERLIAFCEQVARDGIMPSATWFAETAQTLRAECARMVLRYTLKGYTAGENTDAKRWRKRAEDAEAKLASSPARAGRAGGDLIIDERERQMAVEGWTPEHDDSYTDGALRDAAICYALVCDPRTEVRTSGPIWPWDDAWWKPSDDPIRNLVKSGALIAAEIDRLQRLRLLSDGAARKTEGA
jgi:hypothetical protein